MFEGEPLANIQVTCEVCETVQIPASVCSECGMAMRLPPGVAPTGDPAIERMPELELTSFESVEALPAEAIPDLDPTIEAPAPDAPVEFVPDVEATAHPEGEYSPFDEDPSDDLDSVVPDIERTTLPFGRRTPAPESQPQFCPYCGHEQATGRLCDACGRSRTRILPNRTGVTEDDLPLFRCLGCGALVPHTVRCRECGAPLPELER